MSEYFETTHGRQVWKNPLKLDAEGILYRLLASKSRGRIIASVPPSEQNEAIAAALFVAAINEGVLSPADSRRSSVTCATGSCKLPSDIKPRSSALTLLVWEAWDRLFEAADDASAIWARALSEVFAELRRTAMDNVIGAAIAADVTTMQIQARRRVAMGV